MQQTFGIPYWNLDTDYKYFPHTVVSVIVLAVLQQYDVVVHTTGPLAIAFIRAASITNSIHRG